jgi:hypothetical protein
VSSFHYLAQGWIGSGPETLDHLVIDPRCLLRAVEAPVSRAGFAGAATPESEDINASPHTDPDQDSSSGRGFLEFGAFHAVSMRPILVSD